MPFYRVTWTQEFDCFVKAKSIADVQFAAKLMRQMDLYDLGMDDIQVEVRAVMPQAPTQETLALVNGKFVGYLDDYLEDVQAGVVMPLDPEDKIS